MSTITDVGVATGPDPIVDIIDVGHGSCVAIKSQDDVVLVDTGRGGALLEYLLKEGITRISAVIISHADADHIGGLIALLGQPVAVDQIIWNGDAMKESAQWMDLVYLLHDLDRRGVTAAQQDANQGLVLKVGAAGVEVHLLAPNLIVRRLGVGGTDKGGRGLTSNTVSVVAQVKVDGESLLLIPGDLDDVGYSHLTSEAPDAYLRSRYLVLPHHGGWMGDPNTTPETVRALVAAVAPEAVFVSNGRGAYGNPRQEVIDAVRAIAPSMPIGCTQLSQACSLTTLIRPHIGPHAAGSARGLSCAGTIRLMRGNGIGAPYDHRSHRAFLDVSVPGRICVEIEGS